MTRGYFRLWRKIVDSQQWREMPYSTGKLWLWLLMEATHQGNAAIRHLPQGTLTHSRSFMREALEWYDHAQHKAKKPSPNSIERSLLELVEAGAITIKSTPRVIAEISICNWEIYNADFPVGSVSADSSQNSRADSSGDREHYHVEHVQHVGNSSSSPSPSEPTTPALALGGGTRGGNGHSVDDALCQKIANDWCREHLKREARKLDVSAVRVMLLDGMTAERAVIVMNEMLVHRKRDGSQQWTTPAQLVHVCHWTSQLPYQILWDEYVSRTADLDPTLPF